MAGPKIALTGAASPVGRALGETLGQGGVTIATPDDDVRDEGVARRLLAGDEALIHLAPLAPDLPGAIDAANGGSKKGRCK